MLPGFSLLVITGLSPEPSFPVRASGPGCDIFSRGGGCGCDYSRQDGCRDRGDFVVFVIGMRINKPWKVHKWLPVFLGMPRMLKELKRQPESGFLGSISGGLLIVQYWRSFES
jgi:hypothetical protein